VSITVICLYFKFVMKKTVFGSHRSVLFMAVPIDVAANLLLRLVMRALGIIILVFYKSSLNNNRIILAISYLTRSLE
jgi:hypothetical protein